VPDADAARGIGAFLLAHGLRIANVAVLALLVAVLYRQVDAAELRAAVRDADLRFVAAAFALNLPVGGLFAIRSHLILLRLGHRVEPRILVPAMILGNVAGSLTPASAGELLRAAALRSHAKIPAADGIALVLFERGVSIYLLALGTGVAAASVSLSFGQALAVAAAAVPLFAAPAFAPVLLRLLPAPGAGERTSLTARTFARVHEAAGQLRWIFEDRRLLITWSIATALLFAIFTVQIWLLARSIANVVDPAQVWVAFGASQLAGIASLLPLGLGAMDGSLAAILRKFGLTLEQGAATAVLFRLIVTIPYGIIAIGCYLYLQRLGSAEERSTADAPT
jgi:uncharacterized protein (TIRG00374 family)